MLRRSARRGVSSRSRSPKRAPKAPREPLEEDFKARLSCLAPPCRQPMPCTSAMNVRRVKGRAVPGRTPERLAPLVDFPMPAAPCGPSAGLQRVA